MPDRHLTPATPGEAPSSESVQQLVEAEAGQGTQGIYRAWQASNSDKLVLVSDAGGVKISRDNGATAPAQVIVDGTAAGGMLTGTYPNPSLSASTIDALLPPGVIWMTASAGAPAGWLVCDGAAVSRTTYAKLFAALGTFYGAGNGSTTFNLPNLSGRVPIAVGPGYVLGQTGGSETATGPAHTHPGPHSHGPGSHTHTLSNHLHSLSAHTHPQTTHTHAPGIHTHPPGIHTHTLGGHAHASANHDHTSAAHQHNIDHDHPSASGAATASSSALNGRFTAGGANALPDNHTHAVDLPSLTTTLTPTMTPGNTGSTTPTTTGTSSAASDGPTANNTGGPTANDTGGASAASTGVPSNDSTDIPSPVNTSIPSVAATDADSTVFPASYPGPIPIMQPFLGLTFIIRTGN